MVEHYVCSGVNGSDCSMVICSLCCKISTKFVQVLSLFVSSSSQLVTHITQFIIYRRVATDWIDDFDDDLTKVPGRDPRYVLLFFINSLSISISPHSTHPISYRNPTFHLGPVTSMVLFLSLLSFPFFHSPLSQLEGTYSYSNEDGAMTN